MTKIDWKPYPKTQPPLYTKVLITTVVDIPYGNGFRKDYRTDMDSLTEKNGWWRTKTQQVIAWAERPKPYQGETNETKQRRR